MPDPIPPLDFRKLTFPSDELTIKSLRNAFPEDFDAEVNPTFFSNEARSRGADDAIGDLLYLERVLARSAFAHAFESNDADLALSADQREECVEDLGERLLHFGLAAGPEHVRQLVREVESQAIAQAIALGARPRTGRA